MKRKRKIWGGLLCSLLCLSTQAKDVIIKSQADYENLADWNTGLRKHVDLLGENETLNIYFAPGVYKFTEKNRITLENINKTGASINFLPQNNNTPVYIISDGYEYSASEKASETATHNVFQLKGSNNTTCPDVFVDSTTFKKIPVSDSGTLNPKQINRTPEKVIRDSGDEVNAHFRIKLPEELAFLKGKSDDFFRHVCIQHKYWYTSFFGVATGVEGDYLKFDCDPAYVPDAQFTNKGFERFYLTNITKNMEPEAGKILVKGDLLYVPKTISKVYECKNTRFFFAQNTKMKSIKFSGLNFVGAANYNDDWEVGGKDYNYADMALLEFWNSNNISIEGCTFRNIGSKYCLYFNSTNSGETFGSNNYTVKNNKCYDLGRGFIESTAANVTVDSNTLDGVGLFHYSSNAIAVSGKDCAITNNKITNFHGNGIFVGRQEWFQSDQYGGGYNTSTNIEGNELSQGTDFWTYPERNMMEDIHAIYFYGHQNNITIKGNVVHDFPGLILENGDVNNKAIFDDMGGYNCYITGNLVFNVQDIACCITPLTATNYQGMPIVDNNSTVANNVFFAGYTHNPNVFDCNYSDWNAKNTYKTGPNYVAKDPNFSYAEGLVKWDIVVETAKSIVVPDIEDAASKVQGGKCYLTKDYSSFGLSDFVKSFISGSGIENSVATTGVSIDPTSLAMNVGETYSFTATVTPSNASNKNVTWTSDNNSVATVDANGKITAQSEGSAVITVTTEEGNFTYSCVVTVSKDSGSGENPNIPVTNVTIASANVTLPTNSTYQLSAIVVPSNATNKKVTWTSSDNSVASIDANGKITAHSAGTATIIVKTDDGSLTAQCTVTVESSGTGEGSTFIAVTNISMSQNTITASNSNETYHLTATITPSNATNKTISWLSSDNEVATVDNDGNVTIHNAGSCTIYAYIDGKVTSCLILSTVANMKVDGSAVWANGSTLFIKSVNPATLRIYSINGTLVRTSESIVGEQRYSMPQGIYIIQLGKLIERIFIK